ncbi:hypothetical protein V492_03919 [Pseudogymnoascus sp. VKM F-4246]|nr:hypothetical protein V492_03919 [Pseudogymnoascus sp. VKM F-4246]
MPIFSAHNTINSTLFRPAIQYLLPERTRSWTTPQIDIERGRRSLDENDSMAHYNQQELGPGSLPLINISRTPSPHISTGWTSNENSDSGEDDLGDLSGGGGFLSQRQRPTGWKGFLTQGGLGIYLFATTRGWSVYVGLMCLWLMGTAIGLLVINWLVLLTGVYKFPYPLTTTFIELVGCHFFLWAFAGFTRLFSRYLSNCGLAALVAPSYALTKPPPTTYTQRTPRRLPRFITKIFSKAGSGIAGGGPFEFDRAVARKTILLAIVYVLKIHLSTISYAHSELPMYVLTRIGIVPLTALADSLLKGTRHSIPLLSATLSATLNLLVGSCRSNIRVTWDSVLAGVISSFCAALFPVLLYSTYQNLSAPSPERARDPTSSRTTYTLLHHVSLLSIMISLPFVLISGELPNIARNIYFLDRPWHWFMMLCGSLGTFCVFTSTVLLVLATSPLTTNFLTIPAYAFLIPVLAKFRMPMYSWVGIALAFASSGWCALAELLFRERSSYRNWGQERLWKNRVKAYIQAGNPVPEEDAAWE